MFLLVHSKSYLSDSLSAWSKATFLHFEYSLRNKPSEKEIAFLELILQVMQQRLLMQLVF